MKKQIFSLLTLALACAFVSVSAQTTLFSADAIATSDQSFSTGTTEITSAQATITGGKMYAISGQSDSKKLILKSGVFSMTNNNTIFKIELNTPLAAGDVITATSHGGVKNSDNKGLWVSTAESRPNSAPACAAVAASPEDMTANFLSYTVTSSDEYVGKSTLYVHRAAGATQNFDLFKISRPSTKTVTSKVLTGIKINGTSWDISGLSENAATIATGYAGPPTAQFIYTINYDDSSSDTDQTEDIEAVKTGANYVATSTALTTNVSLAFTNVSNVLFSMTDPTAPTSALASKTGSEVTATFSVGGSAYVYNGHSSAEAQMVYADAINIGGSGNSYFRANFPAKLAEGDIISASTDGNFYVASTDSKSNPTTFPYTIPSGSELIGKKVVYVKKNSGSYSFATFTITRPKTISSQTLGGVKEGETILTETTDYSVSSTTVTLTDAHEVTFAPTNIKLINHITFDDASTDDRDVDVTFDGTVTDGYFIGTAKIGETNYTVRVKKSATPALTLSGDAGTVTLNSFEPAGSVKVTVSGTNLTGSTFTAPDVDGVTITPASVDITDGAFSQEFTITTTATTAASTVIGFAHTGATTQNYTLTYSKTAQRGLSQTEVTGATTWDWTKAGENSIQLTETTSPTKMEEFLLANLAEVNNDANFNSQALKVVCEWPTRGNSHYIQGNSIKFTTTAPGTIDVTFSNTGGSRPYRYLRVNGEMTSYKSGSGTMVEATGIAVPAGEVVIDFYIPDATDPQERSGDVVGTTMCRVSKIVFTPSYVPVGTKADRNYASYVTPQKLDFSAAEGITAYIATGLNDAKDAVVLVPVKVVPTGEPIIVKTETHGATVNVPATTADVDEVFSTSDNMLVAGDGETVANSDYYYLASDLFHLATSGTLQKGKAYLSLTSNAPSLGIVFDLGGTTGISATLNKERVNSEIYNLAGQRVAQPTKGLYIVNGKKVVIK